MSIIKLLDKNMINKIAAGEVIENPSSVVKECIENSIDAGSTIIEVSIDNAGVGEGYISIIDNGCGMDFEDAKTCFMAHATSKLKETEDLFEIKTLGFRGEALASIGAIAKVTLTTKTPDSDMATRIEVHGGDIMEHTVAGGNSGTQITIRDIFYNTPARLKFIKSAASETTKIIDILSRYALMYPHIRFKLTNKEKVCFTTTGNNHAETAFSALNGKTVQHMMRINKEYGIFAVEGLISKPPFSNKSKKQQTIFLNGRLIKNPSILRAIDDAYSNYLIKGEYALVAIKITMPFDSVDVNVHPKKDIVRFSNEGDMYKFIYNAIRSTLMEIEVVEHNTTDKLNIADAIKPLEQIEFGKILNTVTSEEKSILDNTEIEPISYKETNAFVVAHEEDKKEDIHIEQEVVEDEVIETQKFSAKTEEVLPNTSHSIFNEMIVIGQAHNLYIIAQNKEGVVFMDQHALHERIIYEKLKNQKMLNKMIIQDVMVPVILELSVVEASILIDNMDAFIPYGISIEDFGGNSFAIRSIPMDMDMKEAKNIIHDVIESIQMDKISKKAEQIQERLLMFTACRSAIKAGKKLSLEEMQYLVKELKKCENPYNCPHGRPIFLQMSEYDLKKKFKRIV